ncbi:MAG TPA: class I SAM-dependent methyltransferase [Dehalococcoidia bacterium]|nr:class I SAM-dependent methyltransferase [Dehalococcoidia bacterium]
MRLRNLLLSRSDAAAREYTHPLCEGGVLHDGECNICGSRQGFCYTTANHPREGYHCLDCGSSARDRQLIKTLGLALGMSGPLESWPRQALTLLETSGYRATPSRLNAKFRYINLMYESMGIDNCVQGNLSCLGLGDDSLDILLTSDVFEHVREDEPAWREVYRVLKPGGYVLLQVPALGEFATTQVRVELRGDEDVFLMEPEYHAENTLVYRNYGNDLIESLRKLGFAVVAMRWRDPAHCISEQTIAVCQKAPYVTLGPSKLSDRAWT